MVDFVKLLVIGLEPNDWMKNDRLTFEGKFCHETGLIKSYIANYGNLSFKIINERMTIQGSLHKYYNYIRGINAPNHLTTKIDKGFNGNRFNYNALLTVVHDLQTKFSINPYTSRLNNIETGVNVKLTFSTGLVLPSLMLMNGKEFNKPRHYAFRRAELTQYDVKAYDKALQYGIPLEVFRYELKYKRMEILNDIGIFYLSDLLNVSKLNRIKEILLKRWNQILFIDPTVDESILSPIELSRYKLGLYSCVIFDCILEVSFVTHIRHLSHSSAIRFCIVFFSCFE